MASYWYKVSVPQGDTWSMPNFFYQEETDLFPEEYSVTQVVYPPHWWFEAEIARWKVLHEDTRRTLAFLEEQLALAG